jgi:Zn finger protein HypA/HybF involved in hydrogenase expression
MKYNMECLKCGHAFEGFIGDNCPKCRANNEHVVDRKELKEEDN